LTETIGKIHMRQRRDRQEMIRDHPSRNNPAASKNVPTGRRMNGSEIFIGGSTPYRLSRRAKAGIPSSLGL